jgi:hypothetical protein
LLKLFYYCFDISLFTTYQCTEISWNKRILFILLFVQDVYTEYCLQHERVEQLLERYESDPATQKVLMAGKWEQIVQNMPKLNLPNPNQTVVL